MLIHVHHGHCLNIESACEGQSHDRVVNKISQAVLEKGGIKKRFHKQN